MRLVTQLPCELRGVESKVSAKTGKTYYIGHFENTETFEAFQFFLGDDLSILPKDVKRGDKVLLEFKYNFTYNKLLLEATYMVN